MGEILGVGVTHYPPLLGKPESYANLMRMILRSPRIPAGMKEPSSWPPAMQEEWAHELERAREHQNRHRAAFARVRQAIDEFGPDAVIIFGDDQYENFKEDVIPPFNLFCMDRFRSLPFMNRENIWAAEPTTELTFPGAGRVARLIVNELIEADYPIAYSYKDLHHERGMGHAFANALIYLDWDQKGWEHPVIPISVNCYGRTVISSRGGMAHVFDVRPDSEKDPYIDFPGPSGPTPRSCFALGQKLRQVLDARPERFVVMASSGWSHAFLTEKHTWLYPDRAFDRVRFQELERGQQRRWAELSNDSIYDSGDQEFKNWICLAGVVPERTPEIVDYLETWIFNSEKCFAIFRD
jgi:hypothetical protein